MRGSFYSTSCVWLYYYQANAIKKTDPIFVARFSIVRKGYTAEYVHTSNKRRYRNRIKAI